MVTEVRKSWLNRKRPLGSRMELGAGVESEPDFAFLLEPERSRSVNMLKNLEAGVQFFSVHPNWKLTDCAVCTTELQTLNFCN